MLQAIQSGADMCHLENQNISANQKMPHVLEKKVLNLLQSDCDTCHQLNFATCHSPTLKLL